jgi:CDP-4-dehydro-6-deoxyglucose reductase, E1
MSWKEEIEKAWNGREKNKNQPLLSLCDDGYSIDEVNVMIESILTGQLSMGKKVVEFEKTFAKYVGAEYAVMVNSGSSANLLAMSVAYHYSLETNTGLTKGCEILVPAVCWSTSVWPIVQFGCKPVFVDVDPKTMNIDLEDMEKKITKDTKGVVAVHVLGNATNMTKFMELIEKNNLVLIEDNCESLGKT